MCVCSVFPRSSSFDQCSNRCLPSHFLVCGIGWSCLIKVNRMTCVIVIWDLHQLLTIPLSHVCLKELRRIVHLLLRVVCVSSCHHLLLLSKPVVLRCEAVLGVAWDLTHWRMHWSGTPTVQVFSLLRIAVIVDIHFLPLTRLLLLILLLIYVHHVLLMLLGSILLSLAKWINASIASWRSTKVINVSVHHLLLILLQLVELLLLLLLLLRVLLGKEVGVLLLLLLLV